MTHRRLAAVATAALLALTGCSSDEGGEAIRTVDETTTTAAPELSGAELIRSAADAPQEHETVTTEMVIEVDGQQFMSSSGSASLDNGRADTRVEMQGMSFRMLFVDGAYYYQYPQMPPGVEWVEMAAGEVSDLAGIDPTAAQGDPTAVLEMLRSVSEDFEPLGSDTLFGVPVEGYRATLSGQEMVDGNAAMGVYSDEMAETMSDLIPETFEVDVWIDGDGLPRRQSWSMDMPAGFGGQLSRFSYRIDFTDWGAPLEVAAPDPSVVMPFEEFLSAAQPG